MMRFVLFLFLLSGVLVAFAGAMAALRAVRADTSAQRDAPMPRPFRLIAFVLLFLLLTGLGAGLLGAA